MKTKLVKRDEVKKAKGKWVRGPIVDTPSANVGVYHLLGYVANCESKFMKADTLEEVEKFVKKFQKKYPENEASNSGYWVDFLITGVTGSVTFFMDDTEVT